MRRYRLGLWLIVGGLAASVGLWLLVGVLRLVEIQTMHAGRYRFFEIYGYADLAVAVVLVAGGVLAAVGTTDQRRRWFTLFAAGVALARLVQMVPWLLSLVSVEISTEYLLATMSLGHVLSLAAAASLAMASLRGGGNRLLGLSMLAVAGGRLVLYLALQTLARSRFEAAPDLLSQLNNAISVIGSLFAVFLVLDLLGAFPPLARDGEPTARLRGDSRGVASGIAVMFVVIGVAFAGLALWGTKQVSATEPNKNMLAQGVIIFVVSMSALWRMRGRSLGVGWLVAGTIALYIAGRLVLALSVVPVQNVTLVEMKLPGMEISLPEGSVERTYTYREIGKLDVLTRHSDLGLVQLSWTTAYRDPVDEPANFKSADNRAFTEIAGEVTIQGTVWSTERHSDLHASWKCPGDNRWFAIEISRYSRSYTVIREIASRIFRSIHCHDITMSIAPPLTIDVPKPANLPGEFTVKWSPDGAYLDAISPGVLLDLVGYADYADHVAPLPPLQVPLKKDVNESKERSAFELVLDNKRVIGTAWRCYSLEIDVAVIHVGPPNAPREPILDAMRAAHCPH